MKKISKRVLAVVLILAMLLPTGMFGVTSTAQTNIPSDAVEFNGHYYYIYSNVISWSEAKSYCEARGGHLATITSSAENNAIAGMIKKSPSTYWIGARYTQGIWQWITGESWSYSNWAKNEPAYKVNGTVARIDGACDVKAPDGHFVFNKGEWDACQHTNATAHSVRLCGFVCEWESGKNYPDGYNFETDSYSFTNYGSTISKKYFTTMYGDEKGKLLYKKKKNVAKGGLCFGMAYTTAAIYNELPPCEIISRFELPFNFDTCENIKEIQKISGVVIGDNAIHIDDYIKYAFIYQFSTNVVNGSVWTNGTTIYNLVRQYLGNDNIGVTIGMTRRDGKGGHRVLAVGIDGNDILIDDPNNTKSLERLTVNSDGSWSFSGLNGWNSDTCYIRYNLDWQMPYKVLKTGTTVVADDSFINDSSTSENYIVGMDIVDKDNLLLFADGDYTVCNENASQIIIDSVDENSDSESGEFYWIDKDKTINVSTQQDDNEIILAGNDVTIGVENAAVSSMTFSLEEEQAASVNIDSNQSDEYKIYFETTDENENDVITTVTGTASGDTVTAYEVEDGIEVEGLNDITVTLETADGTDETTAKAADGEKITITVDDENNTVSTDWKCKHPDENHDGICDNCGEDFTKSCNHFCHSSNKFIQFIYKICRFLWKIFGVNKYCACGKAHY